MGLDIRWPIGLMFSLVGVLLLVASFLGTPEQLERSMKININLYWGLILVVFGAWMLFMAWRGAKNQASENPDKE